MNLNKMTLKQLKALATERFGSRQIASCMATFEPGGISKRRGEMGATRKAYISLLSKELATEDLRRLQAFKEMEERHQRLEAEAA